jgi:predicted dehydrogenase
MASKEKLGVALVGLGTYTMNELAPAFAETTFCELLGAVSNNKNKLQEFRTKHHLQEKNLYTYDTFNEIKNNPDIDFVYIGLPNSMHAAYVIRAAEAGKHVVCEKPMATRIEDCQRMIDACEQNNVKLSIGYRLHFDPFNQEMMRLGQNEILGPIKRIVAKNGMDVGRPDQWRLKRGLAGGGALMDVGIYCVQGVIYTLGELPIAVRARYARKTDPEKFKEVEEGIEWEMEFPNGVVALCETSYSQEFNILRADTTRGFFQLQPAYEYRGLQGETSVGPMDFAKVNQQARQMDDFAQCILENRESIVPGQMGMRDVEILMAIYQAAESGDRVELNLEKYQRLIEL